MQSQVEGSRERLKYTRFVSVITRMRGRGPDGLSCRKPGQPPAAKAQILLRLPLVDGWGPGLAQSRVKDS